VKVKLMDNIVQVHLVFLDLNEVKMKRETYAKEGEKSKKDDVRRHHPLWSDILLTNLSLLLLFLFIDLILCFE
jgi:type VI protein secretion system component VasF